MSTHVEKALRAKNEEKEGITNSCTKATKVTTTSISFDRPDQLK